MSPLSLHPIGTAIACLSCVLLPATAAAAADATGSYSIPAGLPLGQALTRFSEQSDRDILFTPDLVAGLRTRGVSGAMGSAAALTALLSGSDLSWRGF